MIFIGIISIALFKACSGQGNHSDNAYYSNDVASSNAPTSQPFISPDTVQLKQASPVTLPPASTVPFTATQVCKAAIAGMFGRDIHSVKAVKKGTKEVFAISYLRPSDGQRFSFDCKLSDDNVIWRESGQKSDRWNGVGKVEFNVAFTVREKQLIITEIYAASDDITHKYSVKDFK